MLTHTSFRDARFKDSLAAEAFLCWCFYHSWALPHLGHHPQKLSRTSGYLSVGHLNCIPAYKRQNGCRSILSAAKQSAHRVHSTTSNTFSCLIHVWQCSLSYLIEEQGVVTLILHRGPAPPFPQAKPFNYGDINWTLILALYKRRLWKTMTAWILRAIPSLNKPHKNHRKILSIVFLENERRSQIVLVTDLVFTLQ